ncbi:ribosomal RNA Processing 5 isoform X2 [Leptinotarsa decemlineata]|uniref:ribosomal RNA Processing 5 isoform X2 n=1 Tax=Leptinotarsa decemlineata TaxID=7539 RepID=UPI003D3050A9
MIMYLFSNKTHDKTKKPRKEKKSPKETLNDDAFHSLLKIQGSLSYKTIRSGMLILGCIRCTTNFTIEVELPGLTFGHIKIIHISDPLTKYLNEKLEKQDDEASEILGKMFKVGQFVLVKVLNIEIRENGDYVECSLNPSDIYSEKIHNTFEKGMLMWASVRSVLDHGFELDVGVKNCRVFLPSKNVDAGKDLAIGETLWCTIHKCDSSNTATTLRVSCRDEHLKATKIDEIKTLDDLIPGMQIEILIEKITAKGIHAKFLNDYFGFVDENQLSTPSKKLDDYKEGKLITAYVLYIDHPTKITYLTLRNLDTVPAPVTKIGAIMSAQVVSKTYKGIYLRLPSDEKGFVTNKRLMNCLPKNANLDISESISLKFGAGSKHTCRILDYNRLSRLYICTVEQALIKEQIFMSSDVKIGQVVNVTVTSVKNEGLEVSLGHTKGFVPNLFLSNVEYSEAIKKKYQEGFKSKARVLNIDNGTVLLTMKPGQVDSENCLTDLLQAKRGDQYTGVVIHLKSEGALVLFYGNVKGWLSRNYLGGRNGKEKLDVTKYFYRGQIVNPWVLRVKSDRVILGLKQPEEFKQCLELEIGQRVSGVVGRVMKDSIEVRSVKKQVIGNIPVNHLGTRVSLCPSLMRMYKEGDAINDLICIDNKSQPNLLSRREAVALKKGSRWKLKKFEKLQAGNVVRCSYISDCESGIKVLPLILDYNEEILIKNQDIADKGQSLPKFELYQSIIAKIMDINIESKKIHLSIKFSDTFNKKVESTLAYFTGHLNDVRTLRNFGNENQWNLCEYLPGERVDCQIERLGEKGGCLVKLPNGAPGLVSPGLCPGKLEVGTSITGVFLSQNFHDNYTEIALKPDICQRINKVQDGSTQLTSLSSCLMETVVIKHDYVLGVLKQEKGNRQLVYIPIFLHENDQEGCRSYYEKSKVRINIIGKVEDYLIGMSKKLLSTFEKSKLINSKHKELRKKKKKAKVEVSESEDEQIDTQEVETEEEDTEVKEESEEEETSGKEDSGVEVSENDREMRDKQLKQTGVKRKLQSPNSNATITHDKNSSSPGSAPVMSGISSFFAPESKMEQDSSSDDEGEPTEVKKKRKLTPAERANLAREEEERISKIEKELADSTKAPESAEQFDRLLLANPNSSELWTKYIALHTAATEFDKARAVARRALESINLTLVDERFNIWLALLNLENMLGTKESFDKTFNDALTHNDSLQVYLKTIQMLAEAGKFSEMEEKIRKVRNKHKQEPSMWLEVAKVYYKINQFKEARNLKDASLKSIMDKKTQMEIIVRFAIMEYKFGEEEQGAAIFETILSSDPKKVNVWSTYVDQLVKKNKIDQARKVLERSVCQRLPLKSMKSLFLKFRMFEEQHGTLESVEAVKEKAKEYAAKVSNR